MKDLPQLKLDLERWLDQLQDTVEQLAQDQFIDPGQIVRWRQHLGHARESLQDRPLKIAVVGAVKSGKSTLINGLVGCDLLKRGAGITTAFITRIITNDQCGGWMEFKSWPQVNQEINDLLPLLAVEQDFSSPQEELDLHKEDHRLRLGQIRDALHTQLAAGSAPMNPHFLLLNAYLQGYPSMESRLAESVRRVPLENQNLREHQDYVGKEARAVYLRDIELHLPMDWLGNHLEISDCQGSDSPSPVHFAALQNHLLQCHLIVYLISGRTGLRQADYRLLSFIKSLRMLSNTLFALNIDLDWHPSSDDLDQFCQRVQTELSWFTPSPPLFAFSALYHLVQQLGDRATLAERRRMQAWSEEASWPSVTDAGFFAFREALRMHVDRHRQRVLWNHAVNRAMMLAGNLADATATLTGFMREDTQTVARATRMLKERQEIFRSACITLQQAIQKAEDELREEMSRSVDQAFDWATGPIVLETLALVDQFAIPPDLLQSMSNTLEVIQQVHSFYLQFRQTLWNALVEKINVRLIEFAKNREEWLAERLHQAAAAFWSLFATALDNYRQELAALHIPVQALPPLGDLPWQECQQTAPPQFSALVRQVPLSRSILLMKFGLGRLACYLTDIKSRLGRRMPQFEPAIPTSSLEEAIALVKAETRTELILAFRNYRRQFKKHYFLPLLNAACSRLLEEFEARAELAQVSFTQAFQSGMEHLERQNEATDMLNKVEKRVNALMLEMRDCWASQGRDAE
ncbi:MAG TPA: hypothetical protein DEO88_08450 [Syntrophobacteraceae bacterium]|nr:hypothetical protein [Syntrophobacteraceae bacterium]